MTTTTVYSLLIDRVCCDSQWEHQQPSSRGGSLFFLPSFHKLKWMFILYLTSKYNHRRFFYHLILLQFKLYECANVSEQLRNSLKQSFIQLSLFPPSLLVFERSVFNIQQCATETAVHVQPQIFSFFVCYIHSPLICFSHFLCVVCVPFWVLLFKTFCYFYYVFVHFYQQQQQRINKSFNVIVETTSICLTISGCVLCSQCKAKINQRYSKALVCNKEWLCKEVNEDVSATVSSCAFFSFFLWYFGAFIILLCSFFLVIA